jgi:hypothetical protein
MLTWTCVEDPRCMEGDEKHSIRCAGLQNYLEGEARMGKDNADS